MSRVGNQKMNLNREDVELIEQALIWYRSDNYDVSKEYVAQIFEKIEYLGLKNKVAWGHDLSVYIESQFALLRSDELALNDFYLDIDTNFCHGRNGSRDLFMYSIKELAKQLVDGREELRK